MSSKSTNIFWLVLSVLSLIIVIFSHYGIWRYIYIQLSSPNSYLSKYSSLPKIGDKDRKTVINFSEYTNNIKYVVSSLLDQTVKVDNIVLTTSDDDYKLPANLKDIVYLQRYKKTYDGPFGRYMPAILREKDANTVIIDLNPGKIYRKDYIEDVMLFAEENTGKIIYLGDDGIFLQPSFFDGDGNLIEGIEKVSIESSGNYSPLI